jgi:metal-responsive CopG/Arc/MetJ family transcriptional regulator
MRVTIHITDCLGKEIKGLAKDEQESVSALVAKAVEKYIAENRRRRHGENILNLVGVATVSDMALAELESGRADDRS